MSHPVAMVTRARQLRESGWTYQRIAELITDEFDLPTQLSATTAYRWCGMPAWAERQEREAARKRAFRARRSSGRLGQPRHCPEFRLARAAALHEAGLSVADTARVMSFDFPSHPVSRSQVERALETGRWPKSRDELRAEGERFQREVLA